MGTDAHLEGEALDGIRAELEHLCPDGGRIIGPEDRAFDESAPSNPVCNELAHRRNGIITTFVTAFDLTESGQEPNHADTDICGRFRRTANGTKNTCCVGRARSTRCRCAGKRIRGHDGVGRDVQRFRRLIGGGQERLFHSGNASITVSGGPAYVTVSVAGGTSGDSYDFDFAAPPGQQLAPGVYVGAQRAPFREAGRPGIDISGSGRGCNTIEGSFEVKEITVGSSGFVERL